MDFERIGTILEERGITMDEYVIELYRDCLESTAQTHKIPVNEVVRIVLEVDKYSGMVYMYLADRWKIDAN